MPGFFMSIDQENFINKAKNKFNNLFNYDKIIYKHCNQKIIITCLKHGDFEQTPAKHLNICMKKP